MIVVRFHKMTVSVPMKDNETIEEVEDRLVEAIDTIGEGVVISYRLAVEDYDD